MIADGAGGATELVTYTPGDEGAIIECMHACFGVAPRLESWRHLNLAGPGGPSTIILARVDGTVVSHMALLPRRIRAFGAEDIAGHSIDTMTHPAWRRRGLMRCLAERSIREAHARGFMVTYGVANEQSLRGILAYERRTPLGPFPVLVRPVRVLRAGWRAVRARLQGAAAAASDDATVECAAAGPAPDPRGRDYLARAVPHWTSPRFDPRHTTLFQDAEHLPPVVVIRDAAHLAWRYPSTPGSPYWQRDIVDASGIAATAVVRVAALAGVRLVLVMDWHWRHGAADAARELMRDVIRFAEYADVDGVAALAAHGTAHRVVLRRQGFLPVPEFAFPRTPRLSVRPERHDDVARWVDPTHWYYTWGDGLLL
jgi:GNAT superfamily N-acetyltransferase